MSGFTQPKIKNSYLTVKRRFEDSLFVYQVYTVLALLSISFIGYFGIYKVYHLVQEKRSLEKQLTEVNNSLESNIENFSKLQNDVLMTAGLEDNISLYMPSTFSTEEYVVQLSEAVSSAGFILRRITTNESPTSEAINYVVVSAKVDGPGNPVDLVKNIEHLKRITRVTNFNYTLNTHSSVFGDGDATINLEIYKSGDITQ